MPAGDAPIVTVSTGALRGTRADGVDRYPGIPYAAPPFGDRRFASPRRAVPWEGERDASAFGPTAPQAPYVGGLEKYLPTVEIPGDDILTVNVWTPSDRTDDTALPVVVFVHGGALSRGSPAEWPIAVTRAGSPPNAAISRRTQRSAAIWSSTPRSGGTPSTTPNPS